MTDLEQQLQEHACCVRSLAAALLDDHGAGEDVAQETLLAARRQAPFAGPSLRAWLRRVCRRLASRWRRTEARRQHREQFAARPEGLPSAAEDVVRAEQLQAIAAAVAALPPSLREVVLLRHYHDLPPRAIAARLSLSVEATESRLRRGHEQLRARLRAHAPGSDLRAALLWFAAPGAWNTLTGVAVTTKSKTLLAACLLVLLSGAGVWLLSPDASRDAAAPIPVATGTIPAAPAPTAATAVRTEVPLAAAAEPVRGERPSWTAHVTGRVVDTWRHPVAGASVVAEIDGGGRAQTSSDAAGRFAIALPIEHAWRCSGDVLARKDTRAGTAPFVRWTTTTSNDVGTVVLEATGELRLRVCRGAAAVANARVVAVRASYAPSLQHETTSGDDGTAVLTGLPPGRYCIGATATDGSWVVGHADAIAERSMTRSLDLLASTPMSVDVRARGSGEAIAGAQVEALYTIDQGSLPAKVPLRLLVPLPRTDADGRARLTGLCSGQVVGVGAAHPDWRPLVTWNAYPIDWRQAEPRAEVLLDSLDTLTWQLCDGEVPLPADGTMFRILETQVLLRDGSLHFDGQALVRGSGSITAFGPDCYALLPIRDSGPGVTPAPVPLQRTRHLVVELRDTAGQPLVGWPLQLSSPGPSTIHTDASGKAIAEALPAALVHVWVQSSGGPPMQDLGEVDLRRGDGAVTATLGPPRRVQAQVYVNGRPGLPGKLDLRVIDGRAENVAEDADRGVLTFDLWLGKPDQPGQMSLFGMPGLSVGMATLAPGTGPAEVEFRLGSTAGATVDLLLPADGLCQLHFERFIVQGTGGYWGFAGSVDGRAPRRLDSLLPGRYRLHDTQSETIGPEVEVTVGDDAQLTLDMSKVAAASGRVTAREPFTDIRIEVRTQSGTMRQQKQVFDDGTFYVRSRLDAPLVLVAVRGSARSAPVPWTGAVNDLLLVLPD